MARRMGAACARDVPAAVADIFGCARWTVAGGEKDFTAESLSCTLCAMAKRMGAPQPCALYCLGPLEGMVRGLDASLSFRVRETLWDGQRCLLEVKAP